MECLLRDEMGETPSEDLRAFAQMLRQSASAPGQDLARTDAFLRQVRLHP
jgi:hypothetical protein